MDTQSMQQTTREAVKKKFGKKRLLVCKVIPHYPENLEREYIRVTNAYMALFKKTLAEHLSRLRGAFNQHTRSVLHLDDVGDETSQENFVPQGELKSHTVLTGIELAAFSTFLENKFNDILNDFNTRQGIFGLQNRIEKLAKLSQKVTTNEWKRIVKRTLGIDLMDDYYKGLKFQRFLDRWTTKNVVLITKLPQETLGKVKEAVLANYKQGKTTKSLAKEILDLNPQDYGFRAVMTRAEYDAAMDEYEKAKRHDTMIARDQIAKLNAQVTQQQAEYAGVTEYIWRSMNDGRVRKCHQELDDKRFKFAEPPEQWYDTKKKGRVYTGHRANPGEYYECRCVPLFVFNLDTVTLPYEESGKEK